MDSGFIGCVYFNGLMLIICWFVKYYVDDNVCILFLLFDIVWVLRVVFKCF